MKIAFVVTTNYHLLISYILRSSFPNYKKYLIINGSLIGSEELYNSIKSKGHWDRVILLKNNSKNSKIKKFLEYLRLKKHVNSIIKKLCISEVVVFTMGDSISNLFSGNKNLKKVILGEDGTYPYYGGIEMYDFDSPINKKMFQVANKLNFNYFYKKLKDILFVEFKINLADRINEIILLKPKFFELKFDKVKKPIIKADTSKKNLKKSFNELNQIFSYKHNPIYNNIDCIFFDSGMVNKDLLSEKEQTDYVFSLLKMIQKDEKKILVKISPYADKKKLNQYKNLASKSKNISIDDINLRIPWELIYFNNIENFRNLSISSFRSTACISPYLFFGAENDLLVLSKLLLKNFKMSSEDKVYAELFEELIKKISKSFKNKKIYFLESSNEIINENLI